MTYPYKVYFEIFGLKKKSFFDVDSAKAAREALNKLVIDSIIIHKVQRESDIPDTLKDIFKDWPF